MLNSRQVKMILIGAAAGYVISEYLVLRSEGKAARRRIAGDAETEKARTSWASQQIVAEIKRGRYDRRGMDALRDDFHYYRQVSPDPMHESGG